MDPFTEKDLIELLKSIALSMKEIKDELFDIKIAIRDLSLDSDEDLEEVIDEDEEIEEDGKIRNKSEESEDYAVLTETEPEKEQGDRFAVSDEDAYIEIEPNKKFEEDDQLDGEDPFKDNSESTF